MPNFTMLPIQNGFAPCKPRESETDRECAQKKLLLDLSMDMREALRDEYEKDSDITVREAWRRATSSILAIPLGDPHTRHRYTDQLVLSLFSQENARMCFPEDGAKLIREKLWGIQDACAEYREKREMQKMQLRCVFSPTAESENVIEEITR